MTRSFRFKSRLQASLSISHTATSIPRSTRGASVFLNKSISSSISVCPELIARPSRPAPADGLEKWPTAIEPIAQDQIETLPQAGQKPFQKPQRGRQLSFPGSQHLPSDDQRDRPAHPGQGHHLVVILLDDALFPLLILDGFLPDLALRAVDRFAVKQLVQ